MPRKIATYAKLNGAMILNADPSDLPEGFGVVALDTMPSLDGGSIGGRYADIAGTGFSDVLQSAYITKDGVAHDLMHLGANNTVLYKNGAVLESAVDAMHCITGHRNYALIGRGRMMPPRYYGYPLGGSVINEENAITADAVSMWPGATHSGPCNFEVGATYHYAISVVYDGYMHSPLRHFYSATIKNVVEGDPDYISSFVHTFSFGSVSPRATGAIIYRSVASPGMADASQASEYVEVYRKEITPSGFTFTDTNDIAVGASFANNSSLDETLKFCTLNYTVAHEMNNFLFVGNIGSMYGGTQQFPEGARMLYRSLRGKYCQFKIIDDYLALPFTPIAMTSFNNRLLVFGSAEFAIVNPETMTVEQLVNGYGVESALCVHATLKGVFFANKNNMYVYDGREVTPIGAPMLRFGDLSMASTIMSLGIFPYETVVASYGGIKRVIYSARINSILFLYSGAGTHAYVFSLDSGTWCIYSFDAADARSGYIDRANNLYIGSLRAMGSDDKVIPWRYMTRRFIFGDLFQAKKVYTVTSATTMRYGDIGISLDGGGFGTMTGPLLTPAQRRATNVALLYQPSEEGGVLDGIEITYREMLNTI